MRVLAGSEVKDMEGILAKAAEATDVRLEFDFTGTLDGSRTVAAGKAEGKYDAVWFPSNRYLSLLPGASGRLSTSTKIMASPVSLGLRRSVARKLGWDTKSPTWRAITDAAEDDRFTFGMTDPSASNSGLSALVGVATTLSGGGSALTANRVAEAAPDLRRLFRAQTLTSGSSGWLADTFVKKFGKRGGADGLVNYESVLLSLNASRKISEPLTIVTPADGVVTADYPLTLLSGADEPTRDAYAALTSWLRSTEAQQMIMEETWRRPAVPAVRPDKRFGKQMLIELPFPAQRKVVESLISAYQNTIRRASQSIYVLDLSGSMRGQRIDSMRQALVSLAGGNGNLATGDFAVFREREVVTLLGYSDQPWQPKLFSIPEKSKSGALADIRAAVRDLEPGGNTATYTALRAAYRLAARQVVDHPGSLTTIVLLTDGETNRGIRAAEFRAFYRDLPRGARTVPTFVVKFGDADPNALSALAKLTGGRLFDTENRGLTSTFKEIRGYQ